MASLLLDTQLAIERIILDEFCNNKTIFKFPTLSYIGHNKKKHTRTVKVRLYVL